MKLILRKNDSATSLLLFIYNNYMAKSKKDSLKLSCLLEIFKVFEKNETTVRMSLSRAVKTGLLVNSKTDNEVSYTLTPEGKKCISHWNQGVVNFFKRYELRNLEWDNKWYFLNIEFTEDNKATKIELLDILDQLGFKQFNTNTWISPYHQYEKVSSLIEKYNLGNKIIEIHGEIKIYKAMSQYLDEVYGIEKLRHAYQSFVNTYCEKLKDVRDVYQEKGFVENGLALPILHELGFTFFKTASDDAVLPRDVLPEWEGDKAVLVMTELRSLLLEAVYKYLEKFN